MTLLNRSQSELLERLSLAMSGPHLLVGSQLDVVEAAAHLLAGGDRFVLVASSLAGAVRVRELLAPTQLTDAAGLPIAERPTGLVELFQPDALPGKRRALLDSWTAGIVQALVITVDDLSVHGSLHALHVGDGVTWLIQDAQCAAFHSAGYRAAYTAVVEACRRGIPASIWLFAPVAVPGAVDQLTSLFLIPSANTHISTPKLGPDVHIQFRHHPEILKQRNPLAAELALHVRAEETARGVVIAPLGEMDAAHMPASELVSVAREVGVRPSLEPGDEQGMKVERWAALFRQSGGLILADGPEALEILPQGDGGLCLRLVPPESPELVLEECLKLEQRGGVHWIFTGPETSSTLEVLSISELMRIAAWLVEKVRASDGADGIVCIDAEALQKGLELSWLGTLETFASALESALGELAGAGFLRQFYRVRFQLEVAECHRFQPPHIDQDSRYAELARRYETGLSKMDLMQSVQYRLNARPPKDLRQLSRFLNYTVSELNLLFDDLARDGIVVGRQSAIGSRGNRNFEVRCEGDEAHLQTMMSVVGQVVAARRQKLELGRRIISDLIRQESGGLESLLVAVSRLDLEIEHGTESAPISIQVPEQTDSVQQSARMDEEASPPVLDPVPPVLELALKDQGRGSPRIDREGGRTVGLQATVSTLRSKQTHVMEQIEAWLGASEMPQLESLIALARGTVAANVVEPVLARLAALEGIAKSPVPLQVLILGISEQADEAACVLQKGLDVGNVNDDLLPYLLCTVDFGLIDGGGEGWSPWPDAILKLALILPALESMSSEEQEGTLQLMGLSGLLQEIGLSGAVAVLDGNTYTLRRQLLSPEQEGALWLAVHGLEHSSVSREIVAARVLESFLMVVGLADEGVTLRLAEAVLADHSDVLLSGGSRRSLAVGRAHLIQGNTDEALTALQKIDPIPTALQTELGLIKANLQLDRGEPLIAFQSLMSAGVQPSSDEFQNLWMRTLDALNAMCLAHNACDKCTLMGTDFCPEPSEFWSWVEKNPHHISKRAVHHRIEKRALAGLPVDGIRRVERVVQQFGGGWNTDVLVNWVNGLLSQQGITAEIVADDWDAWGFLVQHFTGQNAQSLVLRILDYLEQSQKAVSKWSALVRQRLAADDLAGATALAMKASSVDEGSWDPVLFGRDLSNAVGHERFTELEAQVEGMPAGAEAFLQGVASAYEASQQKLNARRAVERALGGGTAELVKSLNIYSDLVGDVRSDPTIKRAIGRLREREARVQKRLVQASRVMNPGIRAELERVLQEAVALDAPVLVSRAQKALERLDAKQKARDERRSDGERGGTRRRGQHERSGKPVGPAQKTREEGRRRDKESRRNGQPTADRRSPRAVWKPGDAPPKPLPTDDSGKLNVGALLPLVQSMGADSERVQTLMPAIYALLAEQPESGIKLIRDAIPLFEHRRSLDRSLAEAIRSGRPEDSLLPRLRRILDREHQGHSFSAALKALSNREHVEPWKAMLGQLKLKG